MKKAFIFSLLFLSWPAFSIDFFPAANIDYVRQMALRRGCLVTNNAPAATGANMEYLLKTIDICNDGNTSYGTSEFATKRWADTYAVNTATQNLIDIAPYASGGLSSYFDATNPASFEGNTWKDISGNGGDITLANSPTINQDGINFNGTNQYARSAAPLDFSTLSAVTIEVRFKLLSATSSGLLFEHTRDWNTNTGGLGVSLNGDGHQYLANSIHTVHNISGAAAGANNYVVPQTDMQSHTITNTFSAVSNPTGRLLYYDGQLVSPSGKYTAGQAIRGPLKNDYLYFGSRSGSGSFANVAIQSVRIYNKQLSASEVCNNAWIDYAYFGGAIPNCQQ